MKIKQEEIALEWFDTEVETDPGPDIQITWSSKESPATALRAAIDIIEEYFAKWSKSKPRIDDFCLDDYALNVLISRKGLKEEIKAAKKEWESDQAPEENA